LQQVEIAGVKIAKASTIGSAKVNADVSVGNFSVSNLALAESKRSRNFTGEHVHGMLGSGTGSIDLAVQNGTIDLKGF
jgi:hypothetical protein